MWFPIIIELHLDEIIMHEALCLYIIQPINDLMKITTNTRFSPYRESKGGIAYNCIVYINILINLTLPLRVGGSLYARDTPK